jgi:hypothetical protein
MKATIYGETGNQTEYKKALTVTACGLDWFEFDGGWKLHKDDYNDGFILYAKRGRLMARHCYIEIG